MEAEEEKGSIKLLKYIVVLLLILILILLIVFIKNKTSVLPKAETFNSTAVISLSNSYVFASPVRANSGGDLVRITVFVLDNRGFGIADKNVTLGNSDNSLTINDLQSLTDETGKAVFDVKSDTTGVFFIEASVDGSLLPQKAKVTFD